MDCELVAKLSDSGRASPSVQTSPLFFIICLSQGSPTLKCFNLEPACSLLASMVLGLESDSTVTTTLYNASQFLASHAKLQRGRKEMVFICPSNPRDYF